MGSLLPRPGSRPSPKPNPSCQHFGLPASALGPKQLRAPKLLLNQGPSEPCYAIGWPQSKKVKGKVFPYSLPSVGPGADPGVQAVSPQVT